MPKQQRDPNQPIAITGIRRLESFFGSLRTELDGDGPFDTRQAARTALLRFAEPSGSPDIEGWRNRQRLHSSLGSITPANKEQLAAAA